MHIASQFTGGAQIQPVISALPPEDTAGAVLAWRVWPTNLAFGIYANKKQ